MKRVLHIGSGPKSIVGKISTFKEGAWSETRLDIDPKVRPDIVASMIDMRVIPDGDFDAVYSSHNLEHLFPHELDIALTEILRVLRNGGFLLSIVPDVQRAAALLANGQFDDPLYVGPSGPVHAMDVIYGWRPAIARGEVYMAHRNGFTRDSLRDTLARSGLVESQVVHRNYDLIGLAYKPPFPARAIRLRPSVSV